MHMLVIRFRSLNITGDGSLGMGICRADQPQCCKRVTNKII